MTPPIEQLTAADRYDVAYRYVVAKLRDDATLHRLDDAVGTAPTWDEMRKRILETLFPVPGQ